MAQSPNDQNPAVTFDLRHGQVNLAGSADGAAQGADPTAVAIVPVEAVVAVAAAAGHEATLTLGRAIGAAVGGAHKLSEGVGLEGAVTNLAGAFALTGLGALSLERWGKALVAVVERKGALGASGATLIAGAAEGLLRAATGKTALRALPIENGDARVRLLLTSERRVDEIKGWLDAGVAWGDAIARLHARAQQEANA